MSMADASSTSIDDFKRWSVPVLQKYLRDRGLTTRGKKEELVALAYSSTVIGVKVVKTPKEELRDKAAQYQTLLKTDTVTLPDPLQELHTGWLGEVEGCSRWPPTMYYDICNYLDSEKLGLQRKELRKRLMTDYKEGKAYSYFTSGWLKEIFYHNISKNSQYCFLKAEITPSQRVNNVPHKAWVALKKDGEINSAYCTCFAGLGGTCNHIAAMLFKVDYAWQWGINHKSCTSKPCAWKGPRKSGPVTPIPLSEMQLVKPHYTKSGQPINPPERTGFQASGSWQPTLAGLTNSFLPTCPGAAVFQLLSAGPAPVYEPHMDFNVKNDVEVSTTMTSPDPPTLVELAEESTNVADLVGKIEYTPAQIAQVVTLTKGQHQNDKWFGHRVGRITGSVMHAVHTKMATLSRKSANPNKLVCSIMGYSSPADNIPALKYGRTLEDEARQKYKQLAAKTHKCLILETTGFHIHPEKCFLGASPDAIVTCSCCGTGLLEIKCPSSAAHTTPTPAVLSYLVIKEDSVCLRRSHMYYTQIQGQMAACGKEWCDLFIYTKHGHHLERVQFDANFWASLVKSLHSFFITYVAVELLSRQLESSSSVAEARKDSAEPRAEAAIAEEQLPVHSVPTKRTTKRRKIHSEAKPKYVCAVCAEECVDAKDIIAEQDFSIGCDACKSWSHWKCVGYTQSSPGSCYCAKCAPSVEDNN